MAAKVRRQYAGAAAQTSITSSITSGDTSVSIASTTGWPSTALVPFYVVIDPDTSVEEKCSATISGSTLTLTRGVDGTVGAAHSSGATIYPVFTATDADEANELASKFTTKGDIVTQGASTFTTTAVGTNDQLLKADSSADGGVSWATYSPTITLGGDLSGSVTLTNLGSGTLTATVAANSVALGTDTTGNYVATIAGTTNQVSVSGSGSESAAVTLSTPQDIHTGATPTFAGGVFSGSSSGDLLRITQTGAGNALVVEDSANPDSTPFVIATDGRVLAGIDSPRVNFFNAVAGAETTKAQIEGTNFATSSLSVIRNTSTAAAAPALILGKSSGTTVGSNTAVASGNLMGLISFQGNDGTNMIESGAIQLSVDGTVSTGVVPGRLIFSTASTSGTLTERMRIDSSGQVGIAATPAAGRNLTIGKNITGAASSFGVLLQANIQSDVTTVARGIQSQLGTAAASFTVPALHHFFASQGTFGAGSTVTTQAGYVVDSGMTGATNNLGFYGTLAAATGRFNLYMEGTAANYLAGRLGVGATLTSGAMAQVTNTTAADVALIVRGAASQSAFLLQTQNSAGAIQVGVGSGGQMYFNSTADVSSLAGVIPDLQVNGTGNDTAVGIGRFDASAAGGRLVFTKSRNATIGSHTSVNDGDTLMTINVTASDGTSYLEAARISAQVDGTPGTNDMPGRLLFLTTADGGTTLTERMRINNAGNVGINMATFSGSKVVAIGDGTAPTANPTGGGYLYVESGALKYRGSSGTVTTIANA